MCNYPPLPPNPWNDRREPVYIIQLLQRGACGLGPVSQVACGWLSFSINLYDLCPT
jgi:hypothetical protein